MGRAPCCDKEKVRKGAWSPEEDAKLKHYIHTHGSAGNWIALPHKAGLRRCGKSCRLRWLNYLRPNIKHGEFSDEEDTIISTLFASIGSRWSIMATQLPGRTDNDIKNYWNTKLKKRLMLGMAAGNYNTTPPSIASSLDLQSISSSPTNHFMAAQESFSSPMMQNYHSVHGGNMVMFWGEVSSNSSEGSQIENQQLNTYNFYQGSSADDQVQANHEDGLVMWGSSETEADLEEIKQLISSPNSSNIMFDDSPLGLV